MGLEPRCRVILWGIKKETLLPIKMRNTANYKMWKKMHIQIKSAE